MTNDTTTKTLEPKVGQQRRVMPPERLAVLREGNYVTAVLRDEHAFVGPAGEYRFMIDGADEVSVRIRGDWWFHRSDGESYVGNAYLAA